MSRNRKYPHLLPQDIVVWERFLSIFGHEYVHFDYDVRVGDGRPADPNLPANIRQMAIDLSQRRIDAVGFKDHAIDIIELTTLASTMAIGQLIMYPVLYAQRFPTALLLRPLLVCETLESDVLPVLMEKGLAHALV